MGVRAIGQAQAKLLLLGEYAVLEKYPALGIALPCYMKLTLSKTSDKSNNTPLPTIFSRFFPSSSTLYANIESTIPQQSGLGSSAASAVAGVYAVNQLIGEPLTKKQLLPFAMTGEAHADGAYHADNVGPSLLGGIVFIRSNEELDITQLPVPKNLWVSVVHPDIEILTKVAREIMPTQIPISDTTQQMGNLGGLLCGIIQEDYGLISRSLHDVIAEPYRQKLIPEFYQAKRNAIASGALGFSISGAGPSVFALCEGQEIAEKVGAVISDTFTRVGLENQKHISPVNQQGAYVIDQQ